MYIKIILKTYGHCFFFCIFIFFIILIKYLFQIKNIFKSAWKILFQNNIITLFYQHHDY